MKIAKLLNKIGFLKLISIGLGNFCAILLNRNLGKGRIKCTNLKNKESPQKRYNERCKDK